MVLIIFFSIYNRFPCSCLIITDWYSLRAAHTITASDCCHRVLDMTTAPVYTRSDLYFDMFQRVDDKLINNINVD